MYLKSSLIIFITHPPFYNAHVFRAFMRHVAKWKVTCNGPCTQPHRGYGFRAKPKKGRGEKQLRRDMELGSFSQKLIGRTTRPPPLRSWGLTSFFPCLGKAPLLRQNWVRSSVRQFRTQTSSQHQSSEQRSQGGTERRRSITSRTVF